MYYYSHHIGDFNAATRNLSWIQKHSYRELIELYYDREQPLENDMEDIYFRLGADSEEKKTAIQIVLKHFFQLEGNHYHNQRGDLEIAEYQNKISMASRAGKASAAKRKATKAQRQLNTRSTNQEPLTSNHEPRTNFKKPTLKECADHVAGKVNNPVETGEEFYNHFEASGWMVKGGVKMKSWRAALNSWVTRGKKYEESKRSKSASKSDKNDQALRELYN